MSRVPSPPRSLMRILRALFADDPRGLSMIGDLHEEWVTRAARGRMRADLWAWWTGLSLACSFGLGRRRSPSVDNRGTVMARHSSRPPAGRLPGVGRQGLGGVGVGSDLGLAVRNLAKRPLYTLLAVSTLAVGIGANTALYSVANRLLIRPLDGIGDPDRLVELGSTFENEGFDTFSYPEIEHLRDESGVFERVTPWSLGEMSRAAEDGASGEHVFAFWVSSDYFGTLGVRSSAGRLIDPGDDTDAEADPVAVLSHAYWVRSFGGDPDVIGRTVRLNRRAHTIVGVVEAGFRSHVAGLGPEVFLPLGLSPEMAARDNYNSRWAFALAKLTPGTSVQRADAAARAVFDRIAARQDETPGARSARVVPLGPLPGGGREPARYFLLALLGLMSLGLLATCANVAGMVLARTSARTKELAVRAALGASRGRLGRHLGTEALLLFVLGGTVGILGAHGALQAVDLSALPTPVAIDVDLSLDRNVLAASALVTLLTALAFGVLPALGAVGSDLVPALNGGSIPGQGGSGGPGRKGGPGRAGFSRRAFINGQIALSLTIVTAAGLFSRSLMEARVLASGFDPEGLLVTTFDLSMEGYTGPTEGTAFYDDLLTRLSADQQIEGAAVSRDLPLDMSSSGTAAVPDGLDPEDRRNRIGVDVNSVSPDYFDVLGIPILQGRAFANFDRPESTPVAIVSRAMAERAWPGEDPIGKSLVLMMEGRVSLTVVGVATDIKNAFVTEDLKPFVYTPLFQRYAPRAVLTARVAGPPGPGADRLLGAVHQVDPSIATTSPMSGARYTSAGTLPHRIAAVLTLGLSAVALLLSALGVYGIVALTLARRTREIGIRKALGARSGDVLRLVARLALRITGPGLAIGLVASALLAPLLRRLLIGIEGVDPLGLATTGVVFALVIGLATLAPARLAALVHPARALRNQ